ncbi:3D domain-containing protein [Photobacterium phosphoreum]|uniref:3D domain-containing protein n=1 Tax=Photobacterium phosphoreum TaxID=659 RepID=UPI0039B04538
MINKIIGYLLLVLSLTFSVHSYASSFKKLNVTATAYNSVSAQTDSTPNIAAWGDRLKPGMKAIAVSRDLLKMGLKRGSKVKISGLPGEYVVLDKMHHRWSRKIDIYMGKNVRAAKYWGKRRVTITVVKT